MGRGIAGGTGALPWMLALYILPGRELCGGEAECDMTRAAPATEDTCQAKETFST